MKAQAPSQGQDQRQWQEAEYAEWYRAGEEADAQAFSDWLDSPEGHEWLNSEAEAQDEAAGRSWWAWDGFNPEGCHHA